MRHLKAGKRLGRTTAHRKAMMRNIVTSLLEHGQIKTTATKAKEMRKYFDKMIGLGRRGDLHARRQALAFVNSKEAMAKLFDEYGPLYNKQNRPGGYTRILKVNNRLGDNAEMVLIQMVGLESEEKASKKAKGKGEDRIQEVKADLQEKAPKKAAKAEKASEAEEKAE